MSRVAGASSDARATAVDVKALADTLGLEAESLDAEVRRFLADVQAACYDAIVGDRLSLDRLRGIPDSMWPTNQRNELDGEVVETMMRAIEEQYPLGRRWFVRKAEVLGLDRLQLADQYAPVGSDRRVEWTEAVAMVPLAPARLSTMSCWPRLAAIRSVTTRVMRSTRPPAG